LAAVALVIREPPMARSLNPRTLRRVKVGMNTIDDLRARNHERTSLTTPDGVITGYINQSLLSDRTLYVLIGDTLSTAANDAAVVDLKDISKVSLPAD